VRYLVRIALSFRLETTPYLTRKRVVPDALEELWVVSDPN
jgi:hypothetical protein